MTVGCLKIPASCHISQQQQQRRHTRGTSCYDTIRACYLNSPPSALSACTLHLCLCLCLCCVFLQRDSCVNQMSMSLHKKHIYSMKKPMASGVKSRCCGNCLREREGKRGSPPSRVILQFKRFIIYVISKGAAYFSLGGKNTAICQQLLLISKMSRNTC